MIHEGEDWNGRYIAYARAHGRSPKEQLENDRKEWPGGVMAGFMCWIAQKWTEFRTARKLKPDAILSDADHKAFDEMIGA